MKNTVRIFTSISLIMLLLSCGSIRNEAEKRINELMKKTESLDSMINREVEKVLTLDSIINIENDKVKKLDSLIEKSTLKFDSITKEKVRIIEKIIK